MEIQVNGKSRSIEAGQSVLGLLEQLEVEPQRVVVERNREIVPKEQYAEITLAEGDILEILQFVGGG